MADSSEAWRSTRGTSLVARVLGPLALIAVIVAVIVIVSSSMGGDDGDPATTAADPAAKTVENKEGPETPREYLVEPGDSLTSIAENFGVSVKRLERLNPDVDVQTLNEGTPITLR